MLMVAQLGHEELAAAGITNSVFFLITVFPMGISMAFATVISISRGKNKLIDAPYIFRDALLVTLVNCLVIFGILMLAMYQFEFFGQEIAVNNLAKPYLKLLAISVIPMLLFFLFKNVADGFEYTKAGMVVTLLVLLVNVVFNWVFIFGHLGSPAYGLNGAGYATIGARIFGFLCMAVLLLRHPNNPINMNSIGNAFRVFKHERYFKTILKLGIPTGFQFFFEVAAFALAAIMSGWIDAKSLAAHNMAIHVAAITYMFASGISAGSSIAVAKAFGRNNHRRVLILGKSALSMSVITMGIFAMAFLLFRDQISEQFSDDMELTAMGSSLLLIAAIFQLSDGIQAVSIGLLRGLEDVNKPSVITFFAYWVLAIPVAYYLGIYREMGVQGIWIGLTIGLSLSAFLLCTRFFIQLKKQTA